MRSLVVFCHLHSFAFDVEESLAAAAAAINDEFVALPSALFSWSLLSIVCLSLALHDDKRCMIFFMFNVDDVKHCCIAKRKTGSRSVFFLACQKGCIFKFGSRLALCICLHCPYCCDTTTTSTDTNQQSNKTTSIIATNRNTFVMLNEKGLPSQPHPAVKAFSDALQNDLLPKKNVSRSSYDANDKNSFSLPAISDIKPKNKNKQSNVVKKVSQTLGWRNRYSQSEYYPMKIEFRCNSSDFSAVKNNEGQIQQSGAAIGTDATTKSTVLQIKQVQRGEIENTFGTGATVWPASLVLVKYLEHCILTKRHDEDSSGGILNYLSNNNPNITIADLGSGTGVTSIATAFFLGMYENTDEIKDLKEHQDQGCQDGPFIVCTDGCDSVVDLARENIENTVKNANTTFSGRNIKLETNQTETTASDNIYQIGRSRIKVRKYLWGDGTLLKELKLYNKSTATDTIADSNEELTENNRVVYDIILVSDCVLPKLYPIEPLVDAINELSGPQTMTYISYEYRYYSEYDPKEFFISLAMKRGLEVKTVGIEEQHPIYSVDDIEIWEVRRKKTEKE